VTAERFPIEAGHIMAFARAVGDFSPVYHDPSSDEAKAVGGIVAPPTFFQASAQFDPDYPLRPKPGETWFGSGATPSGRIRADAAEGESREANGGTILHAEQHFEYHRAVHAGEVLSISVRPGRTWEKQGRRGGLLHFGESVTEYRAEDGELVVTVRSVGVRTDQTVKD
jgi:hypothetical protein